MSELSHYPGELMTLRLLGRQDRNRLKSQLRENARKKRPALIVPILASEYSDSENRPVFENILNNLRQITYLHKLVFGLDAASEEEAFLLRDLLKEHEIKNYVIQWNSGPTFSEFYDRLNDAGFGLTKPGKGKNMFLGFGIALALGAKTVGLVDGDIRRFDRVQLDRLLYPVVVLDYDFSKAYYTRVSNRRLYGRVKRLLLDPMLLSLKKRFTETKDVKMLGLVEYLYKYLYQLSGEVAFSADLLRTMRFATNWGVEIFTLIEVYRKASSACQVRFTEEVFDHKHQSVSYGDMTKGLSGMAVDITTTLMHALVREEGLEITETFFRDLATTYQGVAEEAIKRYSDLAMFNNLEYDRDHEEFLVKHVFINSILHAGDILTEHARVTEKFLRLVHSHPEFKPFLNDGLAEALLSVESKMTQNLFEPPQTVSWERVSNKMPTIFKDLGKAVQKEQKRFA
ncbi:MAG: hypothetical protein ACLFOY_08430 [Desulfatibacillaceae bacterium]